jgi:hypothetical protein
MVNFPASSASEIAEYASVTNAHVTFHPFYISVTEINHNAKEKTLEISCKMFADDFEQILEKNYKTQLDIASDKDKANFDKLIPDYMNRHLAIAIDGKLVKLTYVGFEKDKESAYCYFQVENVAAPKKLEIFNSILHDFNNTQINIMHVVVNGHRQSTKLDYPNTKASFAF